MDKVDESYPESDSHLVHSPNRTGEGFHELYQSSNDDITTEAKDSITNLSSLLSSNRVPDLTQTTESKQTIGITLLETESGLEINCDQQDIDED